ETVLAYGLTITSMLRLGSLAGRTRSASCSARSSAVCAGGIFNDNPALGVRLRGCGAGVPHGAALEIQQRKICWPTTRRRGDPIAVAGHRRNRPAIVLNDLRAPTSRRVFRPGSSQPDRRAQSLATELDLSRSEGKTETEGFGDGL